MSKNTAGLQPWLNVQVSRELLARVPHLPLHLEQQVVRGTAGGGTVPLVVVPYRWWWYRTAGQPRDLIRVLDDTTLEFSPIDSPHHHIV